MSFDTQAKEFDALEAVIKSYREQPAIVDDAYPEWRHSFEGHLQTFFEAAEANGRFKPNSRFGMKLPAVGLLRECRDLFRHYQGQHEQKRDTARQMTATLGRADEHEAKAAVNRGIANRIDEFLK